MESRKKGDSHNENKPQLCPPQTYAENNDAFQDCMFFSLVAWDHASWPGNDFYTGSRSTDDGVKAAATSSMAAITGIEGQYDPLRNKYNPPAPYKSWLEVVMKNKVKLNVADTAAVL